MAAALDTEDTTVLDPGVAEIEAGLDLSRGGDGTAVGSRVVAAIGVLPGLEARIEASVVAFDPHGVGNAADQILARVGAAWQLGQRLRLDGAVGTGLGTGNADLIFHAS